MATRQRLPSRRTAVTFDFEHAGIRYAATVGRFADGRSAELFISNHKSNSDADVNARDAAILCPLRCSSVLQRGALR
jgi:hypothetical protein